MMPVILLGKCLLPRTDCKYHSHETWEIIVNTEGTGSDLVDGTEYPFSPGSILCVPPNLPHAKVSQGQFKDIFIQSADFIISSKPEVLLFQDGEDKAVETLMHLAYQAYHKKEKGYLNVTGALYDAIQYILLGRKHNPGMSPVIDKLTGMIVENFLDPEFEVSGAIESLPYCKDYIRRLFKQEIGMTPVSYMNSLRLEHAKKLLKQQPVTGHTAGEIALMCGFYDPRYFSRLFRRHTGLSPMQFTELHSSERNGTGV